MFVEPSVRLKLQQDAVRTLAAQLQGQLVQPGDHDFAAARSVWSGDVDRSPALIVRAANAVDVIAAVNFARAHDLLVAVRSGGHSVSGYGTNDDGMVIDLSPMKGISIDTVRNIARIEPGLTWGQVAAKAHEHGLALTSGDTASVGVGGLTLGGGIGWMARKHGLTIDNLRSVDLVTADGRLLTASAAEHADLFWGLRGGGGNFGIATSFEFQLHPAGLIVGGAVIYDAADAESILRAYADYATTAPDELTTVATIMPAPPAPFIPPAVHGKPVLAISVCYVGDLAVGQRVVAPLRALATPFVNLIGPMPYPALFAITAGGTVRGLLGQPRSMFLERLDDEALRAIVAHGTDTPGSTISLAQLRVLGGAMSRVPVEDTAFAHRDKPYMFTIVNHWRDPLESDRQRAWTESYWQAMQPYASGAYVNFLGEEGEERVKAAYAPATYERLAALKRRYNPTNLFRHNQNIKPVPSEEVKAA